MDPIPPEQLAALAKEDLGPLTKSIVIVFTAIAFIAVCLRIFTRLRFIGRQLGWEYLFWSIIFYNTSLTFTKVSILLQYGRIFTVREMRIPLYIVMAICILWGITTIFTSIFTCVPIRAYWQILEQPTATCIDNKTINIVTDLLVAFLPVRVIWRLQIVKRQKYALMGILTIGWFVCVVSFLRLHALTVLAEHPTDNSYYSAPTAYWSAIEMNLAIVCASLPALKPLIVKIVPAFSSRTGSNRYGYGTGGSSKNMGTGNGVRITTRNTIVDDIEMDGLSSKSKDNEIYGKNIYVSRQFEQHFENGSRMSDSESQRDLVDQH
ncbi:hypothetical protein TW65_02271 [Stemphylium lycopersici]|uniref:Rhodopsin domain-containing protein n=1 Tax=Stemphylium lycopersici TaxID=183478 RepID=A0A364MZB0_STELY|nr:hypothetical protein TW65_02271 [Stemphylium lycopersici]RAR07852.1 hypothetical protein DDE83_006270 [Stemphylium lycopersici]